MYISFHTLPRILNVTRKDNTETVDRIYHCVKCSYKYREKYSEIRRGHVYTLTPVSYHYTNSNGQEIHVSETHNICVCHWYVLVETLYHGPCTGNCDIQ